MPGSRCPAPIVGQRRVHGAGDAGQHHRQRGGDPLRPASRDHHRHDGLGAGGARDRSARRRLAMAAAGVPADLRRHRQRGFRRADGRHDRPQPTPAFRGATMALHSTIGFGLSRCGAWGIGVALDAAGGPMSASGWLAAFCVLAAGIRSGRWRCSGRGRARRNFYSAECCRSAEWPPLISVVVIEAKIVKNGGRFRTVRGNDEHRRAAAPGIHGIRRGDRRRGSLRSRRRHPPEADQPGPDGRDRGEGFRGRRAHPLRRGDRSGLARQADPGLARGCRLPAEDAGQGRPLLLDDGRQRDPRCRTSSCRR